MKKRLLSLLLAASMVLGLCPASAFAVDTGGGMFPDEVTAQNIEEQNSSNVIRVEGGDDITLNESTGYPEQDEDSSKPWYTRGWNLYLQSGTYDFSQLSSFKGIVNFSPKADVTLIGGDCEFTDTVRVESTTKGYTVTIDGGTFNYVSVSGASSASSSAAANVTINSGTFNGSTSALYIGANSSVTVNSGTFNAPIRLGKPFYGRRSKLVISEKSTAVFNGGFMNDDDTNGGIIESQKLIIYSDGYPLGSNGGTEKCSYYDSTKNDTIWEYVPDPNAAGADPKGTLYLNGSSLALTLDDSTAVNCNIVMGRTSEQTKYSVYNHNTAPSLNGGTYNGTVSGVVTINSGTFKNTVTAETDTSVISNGTFEKAVTLEYGGEITGGTFKNTVALPAGGQITDGTFEGAVTLSNSSSITGGTFSSAVICSDSLISGGTFTKTSDVTMNGPEIRGGVFRGSLSSNSQVRITDGLFLCDLQQLQHTSTGGYFSNQTFVHPSGGYSCGEIRFVDTDSTFTLPDFSNEKLNYINVVWKDGSTTAATITPSKKITSVDLDATHTGAENQPFTLNPSDFKGNYPERAVHLTTNSLCKVTLPEEVWYLSVQSSGGTILGMAEIGQDHTITLPEGATIKFRDNNGTDAVFVSGSSNSPLQKDGNYYLYTVPGSESTVKRLNKLHIGADGLPITKGTYSEQSAGGDITYYGDGWTYSAGGTLIITGKQTLTDETNAITAPTLIRAEVTGGTYNRARVSCSDGGKLTGAALNGNVSVTGTLDNCTISLTGSDTLTLSSDLSDGSVQNCKITVSNHTSDSGISIYNNGGQILSGNTIDLGGTTLLNDGKLLLGGDTAIKNGTIQNTNNSLLCSNGTVIEADVVNDGQIEDSILAGKVTNGTNGTITDSILYGELENAPANVHKLTVTPAESATVAPKAYDVTPAFNGTAYVTEGLGITVKTSIQSPIWTAEGDITLGEDQLTASTLTLTMPGSDAALSVAKKPGDFDPSDFIVTAPENAVEDGSTVYEVVAVKRPDCEKAYGKISVIYRDAEKNIVPAPSAAGVYTYTVIVADTAEFAGGTVATGSFEIAPAIDPGPSPSGDGDAGTGIALVVGGAALGGAAYLIGTQIWLETNLPDGVIPTSRQQLADLLWLTAGKPEPQSSVLFTDISAEAVDSQKAARWCVEQGLLSDKGEAFKPGDYVFRPQVIKAWNDVQALQNTAQ